jgi:hypothetical protein
LVGAIGAFRSAGLRAFLSAAFMMVLFFHAARLAMVVFDPYLSSRPLAEALLRAPDGTLISGRPYYAFSSIFFYTNRTALILNGRFNNLEYGSYAPGAPNVFIDDAQFRELWMKPDRYYVIALDSGLPGLEKLVGPEHLYLLAKSGGKRILTNQPLGEAAPIPQAMQTRTRRDFDGLGRRDGALANFAFRACFAAILLVQKDEFVHLNRSGNEDRLVGRQGDVFGLQSRIL